MDFILYSLLACLFCFRRVIINSESEMPTNYGTTPGGTMFAHTPGGTRIVYERAFLMQMRQSPLAKTPPANLPLIPGVTVPSQSSPDSKSSSNHEQKLQTVKGENNSPIYDECPAYLVLFQNPFLLNIKTLIQKA